MSKLLPLLAAAAVASLTAPAIAAAPPASVADQVAAKPATAPAPRGLDGHPDLSGYWRPIRTPGKPGGNMGKDEPNFRLPFTELGERALLYSQNHTVDPEAICILGGIPRHNASGLAFEVIHTPGRFATLYNYNTSRLATIGEGLKLPANPTKTYFGTAVAHWEGDTLVVETNGLRDSFTDKIWLDENGDPTSDQTTVVERWSRPHRDQIDLEMTITDPKYYSRPIVFRRSWTLAPNQGVNEHACNENNLDAEHIGPGAGVVGPDGNRGFGYSAPLPATPPGPEAYGIK